MKYEKSVDSTGKGRNISKENFFAYLVRFPSKLKSEIAELFLQRKKIAIIH